MANKPHLGKVTFPIYSYQLLCPIHFDTMSRLVRRILSAIPSQTIRQSVSRRTIQVAFSGFLHHLLSGELDCSSLLTCLVPSCTSSSTLSRWFSSSPDKEHIRHVVFNHFFSLPFFLLFFTSFIPCLPSF